MGEVRTDNLSGEPIILEHDALLRTGEGWYSTFNEDVARCFGRATDPVQFLDQYNEVLPEFDRFTSSAYLDLQKAIADHKGHCLTAALALGSWAENRGFLVSYFPRSVMQHAVIGLSRQQLVLPEEQLFQSTSFGELWKMNRPADLALFEYRMNVRGLPNFHQLNASFLDRGYKERMICVHPSDNGRDFMERIGWWQEEEIK